MISGLTVLQKEVNAFFREAEKIPERYYLLLFGLYLASILIQKISFILPVTRMIWNIHLVLYAAVMWGSAIYLFYLLSEWKNAWKNTSFLIAAGSVSFLLAAVFSKILTTDSYLYVMGGFFCLMAVGRSFRRMLLTVAVEVMLTLTVGALAWFLGLAQDIVKPDRAYGVHSLGIIYPNNWGYLVYLLLVILWYLYLLRKKLLAFLLFWGMAVFMYFYITCQTIALLAFCFPVMGALAEVLQNRRAEEADRKALRIAAAALPFLAMGLMLFGCVQMDWIHEHLYGTPLHTLAMRFVEGGYALKLNGVSFFGHPFKRRDRTLIEYDGDIAMVLDSGYIHYLIIRGILWFLITFSWLGLANVKALKNRDFRLLAISIFMLVFSVMERPGLDVWYNFVLLYPLAAAPGGGEEENCVEKGLRFYDEAESGGA